MIFVDTSFWIALRNRRDRHHETAVELIGLLSESDLITSNHVRGETWTYLRRKLGHPAAVSFLDAVSRSRRIQVLDVEAPQEAGALQWLRQTA